MNSDEAGAVLVVCTYITSIPFQYLASSAKIVSADLEISNVTNIEDMEDQTELNPRKRPGQTLKRRVQGDKAILHYGRKEE
jgi:hypothetical protein